MIKIVCVGSIKERFYKQACEEYKKRLSRWTKIDEVEIKEEDENRYKNINSLLEKEATKILQHIKNNQYVIVFDVKGIQVSSEEFAEIIKSNIIGGKDMVFVVGGSSGIGNTVKTKADKLISFSKLTFPHQLFRVLLYEQIYRAFTIIENVKYHK